MREIVHVQAGQCGNQVSREAARASGQRHRAMEANTKFCTFSNFLGWLPLKTILGRQSGLLRSACPSWPPWRRITVPPCVVFPSRQFTMDAKRSGQVSRRAHSPSFVALPTAPEDRTGYMPIFQQVLAPGSVSEGNHAIAPNSRRRYCTHPTACAPPPYSRPIGIVLPVGGGCPLMENQHPQRARCPGVLFLSRLLFATSCPLGFSKPGPKFLDYAALPACLPRIVSRLSN